MLRTFRRFALLCALLRSPSRGVALVEFGLAAPFLILLIVGLIDLGFGFYDALQVQGAATSGAEYATAHGFCTAGNSCCGSGGSCPIACPSGAQCPVTIAVQTATNLGSKITMGSDLTFAVATPQKICACAGTGQLTQANAGFYNPTFDACCASGTSTSTCAPTPSCGAGEPPGVYASVATQMTYQPLLPYPGIGFGVTLKGQAYRRIK